MRKKFCAIIVLVSIAFMQCTESIKIPKHKYAPSDWFYAQRAYPYDKLDHDTYLQEIKNRTLNATTRSSLEGYNDPWEIVGPRNINGRITDIEMPSNDINTIYAGTASGGIFKSTNQGNTWLPIFDDALSLSIGDIALAPSKEDIIYVGTGEANAGGGSLAYDGVGVYRSSDAGKTWTHLGLEDVGSIGKVVIHPTDPDNLYVATMGRLFGNNKERGVYKSIDGGKTWKHVLYISDKTGAIDLALNPENPDIVYAAMWERERRPSNRSYGGTTSGIYKTTDGGESWEELKIGLPQEGSEKGRIGIAIAPSNTDFLYAMYAKEDGSLQGMYRTTNGGDQWVEISKQGISNVPYIWWFGKVFVNPNDETMAYATSLDMFRTRNGGNNWFPIFEGSHVDHHALFVHPQNTDLVVNGNDGGVYISQDGGVNYEHKNSLPNLQFYTCAIDNTNPERIFGGTQDNGTLMITDDGSEWDMILGGDGFRVLSDPNNPNIIFAESQFGNLRKSTNNGGSFFNARDGITGTKNWNTPFIMDPNDSEIMYYGSDRVFKSTNQGVDWSPITNQIPNPSVTGNIPFGTLTALSVSPLDSDYLYAGTDDGNVVFINQRDNNTIDISADLPDRWVTSIAADPHDSSSVYLTLSGFRYDEAGAHVYKSSNLGQDWVDISINLPDVPVNDIIVDPAEQGLLYIATDLGVYFSYDDGKSWQTLGTDLPLVPVTDLDLHTNSRTLAAATYGRSIFTYLLPFSTSTESKNVESDITIYPNPSSEFLQLKGLTYPTSVSIYDLSGKLVKRSILNVEERISIASLNPGFYIIKAENFTSRFIKI